MSITKVSSRPKKRVWELVINVTAEKYESEEKLLALVASLSKRPVYYTKTHFSGLPYGKAPHQFNLTANRKKKFTGGYYQYTFWFTSDKDATMAKLLT
jgi:hypothetical protein